ncbi:hypothetical protein C9J21_18175 [Photobacterium phosphoreum]|uniref:hypothetical protein n=1 Tax=Photobacterium phosphoreum TaxID=659 RepID=UPI000D15865A|nr:hypothetical protein [Photobacterium phosphoreum]PSW30815.1 hypothetical protein C9J21_18175 [Photobacterium phosphoreum]
MADVTFAHQLLCSLRYNSTNRSNASILAKEFSQSFDISIELVNTIQKIDFSLDILSEAANGLPNPNADPIICSENRNEFLTNLVAINSLVTA